MLQSLEPKYFEVPTNRLIVEILAITNNMAEMGYTVNFEYTRINIFRKWFRTYAGVFMVFTKNK